MKDTTRQILEALATEKPYEILFNVINTFTKEPVKHEVEITKVCVSIFELANAIVEEKTKEV